MYTETFVLEDERNNTYANGIVEEFSLSSSNGFLNENNLYYFPL